MAYAGFFNGGSVTSHRDDVKISQLTYSSSEVLKRIDCNVSSLNYCALAATTIKLYNAITKETIQLFHSHFCLILCASLKERKGFTETQAVNPWLKIY